MRWLHLIVRRLRALVRKEQLDTEMSEEMRLHLELQTELNIARGHPPEEAHYAARREFGGVEQIKERARDQRGWLWLEQAMQDVRFAVRALRKSPGFTITAVLTLALGIGVNTSMFTGFQALLMRELPYPQPERLVHVFRTSPHSQRWPHAPGNFLDLNARNQIFERMAAVDNQPFNLAEPGQAAERVRGLLASADLLPLLGIEPEIGRFFTAEEDRPGANNVVVLSHAFWLRRYGGDPAILHRTLRIDGESVNVVGVIPERFRDAMLWSAPEVIRPIAFTAEQRRNHAGNYLKIVARLKPGVSMAQAQAEMNVLAERQDREHGNPNASVGLRLVAFESAMDPKGQLVVWLTLVLAGFVLLIACANLANLQFARTAMRTHEFAIRGALGAARGRLLRQLLTESWVLAVVGGALGLILAVWGNQIMGGQFVENGEALVVLPLNLKILAFTLVVATGSGFAFGLAPAWLASRTDVNGALKQGSRGSTPGRTQQRLQHGLIVAQVALALILLTGAGLLALGLQRFAQRDPGWRVDGLLQGGLSLPERNYGRRGQQVAFVAQLQDKLTALPGVERATVAWSLPVSGFSVAGDFSISGRPVPVQGRAPLRNVNGIAPGYFETLGMRLLSGRDFAATDRAGQPNVVIINETMARTFWPNTSPLGQRIDAEEIVGVVSDVRFPSELAEPQTRYQTYRPFAQDPRGHLKIAVRGAVTPAMLRQAVADLDADLPLNAPGLVSANVARTLGNVATGARLFGGFALLGLLLAAIGLYGVIAGFVSHRTNEIGIRMALGAKMQDVLWLVIGKGLKLTLVGAALGLVGAIILARVMSSAAPGLDANAPVAIAGLTGLLVAVALLACWIPARRAAKVDPMSALRCD